MRDAWPKLPALLAWLARNPHVSRVAWVDDDLGGDACPDRARRCTEELSRRGVDVLLVAPAAAHGIGPHHVTRLERWIGPQGARQRWWRSAFRGPLRWAPADASRAQPEGMTPASGRSSSGMR
ncbi:hypothetical protein [Micromonospora sp. KC723]|uniref:hypothetical protein n=1 Tax=Micromonospora sp. KC723 TaxID=2530381 RepID=UPI0010430ED2|nr:hypothetical protein [Micromonospora sp. KC723]TDB76291.1 hypothetical protein E1165_07860 [Micromonospora sp. KC723]